jgi:hypothetical protein
LSHQVVWETCQFFFLSFRGSCLVSSSLGEVSFVLRFQKSALWPTCHLALDLWTAICLISGTFYHRPLSALLPLQSLFNESSHGDELLAPPLLWCAHSTPQPCCVFLFSFLFIIPIFFFVGWVSVCLGYYAGLSQGCLWEPHVPLTCSPVGLHLPSRSGDSLWWHGNSPVSQCNVAWRSLCAGWGFKVS